MPTALDRKLVPKVLKLVNKFGRPCVIERIVQTRDTSTNVLTSTPSYQQIRGIVEEVGFKQIGFRQHDSGAERDTLIQEGDLVVSIAASGLSAAPTPADRLYFGSLTGGAPAGLTPMRIVSVQATYTGELAALYQLVARGLGT